MAVLPIGGSGVVPSSSGASAAIFNELNALTRRAYIRRLIVQIYFSTPSLMVMMSGAQKSAGGLNQITVPVQGNSMVQGSWAGPSGNFNKPGVIPGVQAAAFNTAYFLIPVPLMLNEVLIQSTEAIIPILDARMNDVKNVAMQQMGSALFSNNSADALMPSGFFEASDNGNTVATYGGINRTGAGNSFWQGQVYNIGGAFNTRQLVSTRLIQATDVSGGEMPTFVVMNPSNYASLNNDFIGVEQYRLDPNAKYSDDPDARVRSSFPNLNIAGVPVFLDHWCPVGTAYAINTKYTGMYMDENAAFDFSGFESLIAIGQLAQVGVALTGYNAITTKPVANVRWTGITSAAY